MIRRNMPLGEEPKKWHLISQVEHARVSAELAQLWGNHQFDPLICPPASDSVERQCVRQELLDAIAHHDDGWVAFEADPAIDAVQGRPYTFYELPLDESLAIWGDSITLASRYGALAQWVVAGHFARLLRDSHDAEEPAARRWLERVDASRDRWLREWQAAEPELHTRDLADAAQFALRLFDWISLWLATGCPALASDPTEAGTTLDEGPLAATPIQITADPPTEGNEGRVVRLSPWPFAVGEVPVDALGYTVPVDVYSDQEQLTEKRVPLRIHWLLLPG